MDLTRMLIDRDEGDKALPYQDSKGIWTIGIGHNMEANGMPAAIMQAIAARQGKQVAALHVPFPTCMELVEQAGGLVPAEIDALFALDLKANCSWLWAKPWWPSVNIARQAALQDMAFNLGHSTAQTFTTFYGICAIGDWNAAADDLEFKTKVAKELPKRYGRLEEILRTGTAAGIFAGAP